MLSKNSFSIISNVWFWSFKKLRITGLYLKLSKYIYLCFTCTVSVVMLLIIGKISVIINFKSEFQMWFSGDDDEDDEDVQRPTWNIVQFAFSIMSCMTLAVFTKFPINHYFGSGKMNLLKCKVHYWYVIFMIHADSVSMFRCWIIKTEIVSKFW